MRPSTDSQNRIRRAPKKLAAMMPVRSRMARLRSTPRPGIWKPTTAAGGDAAVAVSPVFALLLSPWEVLLASAGLDSPSLPASDLLASTGLDSASLPASAFAAGFAPEFLKSVAYQPLPLRWNPASEMSLERLFLPQTGQSDSGASVNFCSASSLCPQAAHRYS